MRIVAGSARGRKLATPPGTGTRPTSDKVRGAVMNLLGQFFDGGAVLDLYAGSGALALEALSRGCQRAVCVEADRRAADCLGRNAAACGFADRLEVLVEPVERALGRLPLGAFALVFVDPPYRQGPAEALRRLAPLLASGGAAVVEHAARHPPDDLYGALRLVDRRAWGDTGVSIYRLG